MAVAHSPVDFNSSRPSDAYMRHYTSPVKRQAIIQISLAYC